MPSKKEKKLTSGKKLCCAASKALTCLVRMQQCAACLASSSVPLPMVVMQRGHGGSRHACKHLGSHAMPARQSNVAAVPLLTCTAVSPARAAADDDEVITRAKTAPADLTAPQGAHPEKPAAVVVADATGAPPVGAPVAAASRGQGPAAVCEEV